MNFVDAWEQNGTLGTSQQKMLALYRRFHPYLLGCHLMDTQNLDVYFIQIENEIFKMSKEQLGYSNMSKFE